MADNDPFEVRYAGQIHTAVPFDHKPGMSTAQLRLSLRKNNPRLSRMVKQPFYKSPLIQVRESPQSL